jgi:glycosidase
MSVPPWVQDRVFYQIFPDRFYNGDPSNDPVNLLPWDAKPMNTGFQGGDLHGVIERMYYLLDLGINGIYLNPIFLSPSNHRYNTVDYYQIDPKLGTKGDLDTLLSVAHRNHIRVVLDGVFNHCGRGFFAFNDLLENQANSPYADWYHIKHFPIDAYSEGDADDYLGWWKYKSLPKFNTDNPKVRQYLFGVAKYWLEQGIDGWRLDVPNEIDDDGFWDEFRKVVKDTNPDAYLLGEIWDGDPRWVGDRHFDGLMHYPLRTLILDLLNGEIKVSNFMEASTAWLQRYPLENSYAMYTTLGSHDTERVFSLLNKSVEKLKLAFLILLTYPGAPGIYYGDEIGMEGGKDPACRHTFNWDESTWKIDLRQWVKMLIRLRKERISLRRGDFQPLHTGHADVFAYSRTEGKESFIIVGNVSPQETLTVIDLRNTLLNEQENIRNLLGTEVYGIQDGQLSLEIGPWAGMILGIT